MLCHFSSNLRCSVSFVRHYQTHFVSHQQFINHNDLLHDFDLLLRHCFSVQHCKQVHASIVVTGCNFSAFLAARVVSVYARFERVFDARKVFDATPFECKSNLLLWNSILRVNVSHGYFGNALNLFVKMRKLEICGDGFTFPLLIRACAHVGSSSLCKIIHGQVLEMGLENRIHVANELMGMYAKQGRMRDARILFDRMLVRSCISWNIMISSYAFNYDSRGALEIFKKMESEGLEPNSVTWTSLMSSHARSGQHLQTIDFFRSMMMRKVSVNAEVVAVVLSVCTDLGAFENGKMIHGYAIKGGFEDYLFVKNALISVYGKCGAVNDAENLFMEMRNKNIVSWNSLITSYAEAGLCDKALGAFLQLKRLEDCQMLGPNVVSWSALISGFAAHGRGEESLELFRQMQLANVMANSVTLSSVLSICAELAILNLGKEIHGHVIRASMDGNILVGNGLLNMYTKCGCLEEGHLVFEKIQNKDLISWNSMIMGYGMHGLGVNALRTFYQMTKSGNRPDVVTFVAVLSACSHAGLVTEGRKIFDQMIMEYKIETQMEHYACMVDLLGRSGLLEEAIKFVKNMPMEPNVFVWSALLNSCRMHRNTEIAEETASHVLNLNIETTGSYMLLSNIYSASGRWDDSAKIRASARTKGLKKNPGQSWIEVKNSIYMFSAGNNVLEGLHEVYEILEQLTLQMEDEDFIAENYIIQVSFEKETESDHTGIESC
ncbi:hypothetical protein K2173_009415 [Erythroxylum novogranatense]|uniref:Pentatricopeptide repeat-containing protein At1g17630 n=1 Tax=Erythroxylum novogranatense TaxID=1862640 RepID=A0AAV8U7B0_9ROSI|nr:hypothetical protein K2173_009415 [Erythroxylum novogranatense]